MEIVIHILLPKISSASANYREGQMRSEQEIQKALDAINNSELAMILYESQRNTLMWVLDGSPWKDADVELPEHMEKVLVMIDYGPVRDRIGIAYRIAGKVWSPYQTDNVTHWMPLPAPPKEGNDESAD